MGFGYKNRGKYCERQQNPENLWSTIKRSVGGCIWQINTILALIWCSELLLLIHNHDTADRFHNLVADRHVPDMIRRFSHVIKKTWHPHYKSFTAALLQTHSQTLFLLIKAGENKENNVLPSAHTERGTRSEVSAWNNEALSHVSVCHDDGLDL